MIYIDFGSWVGKMFCEPTWWTLMSWGLGYYNLVVSATAWQCVFCCFLVLHVFFLARLMCVLLSQPYVVVLWVACMLYRQQSRWKDHVASSFLSRCLSSLLLWLSNTSTHTQTEDLTWLGQAWCLDPNKLLCHSGEMSGEWTLALHLLSVGCLSVIVVIRCTFWLRLRCDVENMLKIPYEVKKH